jgi:hypothetical protein
MTLQGRPRPGHQTGQLGRQCGQRAIHVKTPPGWIGLHHLRLTVTDLARSRAFYRDVVGFQLAPESPTLPARTIDPASAAGV